MSDFSLCPMTLDDYDAVAALWRGAEHVCLGEDDSAEAIGRYLARNPGLSLVAVAGDGAASRLVGAVLCGHDGRRGLLHHLAVDPGWRRRGVGRALAEGALAGLRREQVRRAYLMVLDANEAGRRFWRAAGWHQGETFSFMFKDTA